MLIRRLQVQNIRNLSRVALSDLKLINIFYGSNGSGKTSLLESIHLLLVGRSFRYSQFRPVLSDGQEESVVFAELSVDDGRKMTVGLSRRLDGKPLLRLDGERLKSLAELVQIAPVQVLNADSFALLTGGPAHRREYLDWGLFHVEPSFFPAWRLAQRALKQRNSLIRHGKIDRNQLNLWSMEYARYGEQIDAMRQAYVEQLVHSCREVLGELCPAIAAQLDISYVRGWAKDQSLERLLLDGMEKDIQQGYTRNGPHRADLRVNANAGIAADILSRGQLKVVIAGLHLAQAALLRSVAGKKSIFLIDDLAAELDSQHRHRLCDLLERLDLQVFATSIERNDLLGAWGRPGQTQVFHVEQGKVFPEANPITTRGIE